MGYFAKIEDNLVTDVIAINNSILGEPEKLFPETELTGVDFIKNVLKLDGQWKQTSYNNSFRGNYAGIGYSYNNEKDVFMPPKIFNSFVWDDATFSWIPPIARPNDEKTYNWDESTISWIEVKNDPN
jgi:hypothetical protein